MPRRGGKRGRRRGGGRFSPPAESPAAEFKFGGSGRTGGAGAGGSWEPMPAMKRSSRKSRRK